MENLLRATFLALMVIAPVATPGLAADGHRQGTQHQGDMRFRDRGHDRRDHDRFFHDRFFGDRDDDRFFRNRFFFGDTAFFYPAPVYPYELPYYWYCANPQGYYPYISQCWTRWQAIPAPPR